MKSRRGAPDPSSIVVPIAMLSRVELVRAETTAVDFADRTVTVAYGLDRRTHAIRFDYLLIVPRSPERLRLRPAPARPRYEDDP